MGFMILTINKFRAQKKIQPVTSVMDFLCFYKAEAVFLIIVT